MKLTSLVDPLGNLAMANMIGLKIPEHEIKNGCIEFTEPPGIDLSFSSWWNGEKWELCTCAIHQRRLLDGDLGPYIDINTFTMFPINFRDNPIKKNLRELAEEVKKNNPTFNGHIGIEVKVSGNELLYQKISPSINPDEYYGVMTLAGGDPFKKLDECNRPKIQNRFYASMRIYSYPYSKARNLEIELDADGERGVFKGIASYIIGETGISVTSAWRKLLKKAKRICPPDACYRTDGEKVFKESYNEIREKGIV